MSPGVAYPDPGAGIDPARQANCCNSIVDAETAPAKPGRYHRLLETEIASDPSPAAAA